MLEHICGTVVSSSTPSYFSVSSFVRTGRGTSLILTGAETECSKLTPVHKERSIVFLVVSTTNVLIGTDPE